jgi:hypothetical protein
MKKTFLFFCKLAISGILALAILSGFALVYYNPPTAVANQDKFTNSKFAAGAYWSDMTEGVGYGKINHLGFNELDTVDSTKPMIAVIGSSHTEALQVPQGETYTAQLQLQLKDKAVNCVNFGISGHFLNISVSNFRYFAEAHADANVTCAVIETANLSYTPAELEKMLNEEYHSDLQPRGGLYSLAQKIPYLRLLYKQFQDTRQKGGSSSGEPAPFDYEGYEAGLMKVLEKLSGIAAQQGYPLMILYHDAIAVEGGSAFRQDDARLVEIFKSCCEKNGILFVDVTDRFITHYESTYELPYGYPNTTPGAGHLNTLGHRLIAEELAAAMEGN